MLKTGANDTSAQTGARIPQTLVGNLEQQLAGNSDIDGLLPIVSETVPAIDSRTNFRNRH